MMEERNIDCPETVAFLASGFLKMNTHQNFVRADGRPLPRGVIGSGGIAKVLKDEASNRKCSSSSIVEAAAPRKISGRVIMNLLV